MSVNPRASASPSIEKAVPAEGRNKQDFTGEEKREGVGSTWLRRERKKSWQLPLLPRRVHRYTFLTENTPSLPRVVLLASLVSCGLFGEGYNCFGDVSKSK